MEKTEKKRELLENEWYHVRHSGEIPEIALHASLFYLTSDREGPNLQLQEKEQQLLYDAALQRYREIILRDIVPENRDTTIYRGVLRSICNWRRLKRFCDRHSLCFDTVREEVRVQFRTFLDTEINEIREGLRASSINCTFEELFSFAVEIDVPLDDIRHDLERICI